MPLPCSTPLRDPRCCLVNSEARIPEILAESGVGLIQLRDKHASARAVFEASKGLGALGPAGRPRDRERPAGYCCDGGCGRVHVGQDDLPVEAARASAAEACGWEFRHTISRNSSRSIATSADYIAVGPVFPTATKANPDPVVGLDLLRAARRLTRKPLVAIGGITVQSAESVYRAGADSIAVVGDLLSASKPALRATEYIGIASRVLAERD